MHERIENRVVENLSSDRSFGLVMAVACIVFALIAWFNSLQNQLVFWLLGGGVVFLVLALAWTTPLRPLNKAWFKFGLILHKIISPLVMGVMFFLVLSPIGLTLRLFGKDLLNMKRGSVPTYWRPVDDQTSSPNMTQQF